MDSILALKIFVELHTGAKEWQIYELNEDLFIEKNLVKLCWFGCGILVLISPIASIFAFKWYSLISIPIIFAINVFFWMKSSLGNASTFNVIIFFMISFLIAYSERNMGTAYVITFILLPLPSLLNRLTYKLSTTFIRGLVLRNKKAFDLLNEKGIFVRN